MATRLKSIPKKRAQTRKRPPRTKSNTEVGKTVGGPLGAKDAAACYLTLLLGFGARLANTLGCNPGEQVARLRSQTREFDRNTTLLLRDLSGERRPQAGDLVLGEVVIERADKSVWARLYGKICACDDLNNVHLRFERSEYEDGAGGKWDKEVGKFLKKEIVIHAAEMTLNEDHREWRVVLAP